MSLMFGRVGAVALLVAGCHRAEPRADVVVDAGAPVSCDLDATVKLATSQIDSDAHDAVDTTEKFLASCPDDAQVHATKMRAHARLQQWDAALVEANKVVAASPNDAALHATRGDIYNQLGQIEDAADDYRQALGLNPAIDDVPLSLASLYEGQGRNCQATQMLTSAVAAHKDAATRKPLEDRLAKLSADKPCSAKALKAAKDRAAKLAAAFEDDGRAVVKYTPGHVSKTSVVLNGKLRLTMVVDTGAQDVAIPRHVAEALGIDVRTLRTAQYQTAGGIRTAWVTTLKEVRVQGLLARDVNCAIGEDRDIGTEGLLGQSFLGRFRTTQDAQHGVIEIAAR